MARFLASTQFDIEAFLIDSTLGEFFLNAAVSGRDNRVIFTDTYDGLTERLVLRGTFGNFVNGTPTTGTITRAQYSLTGGETFQFTNISMSVEEFNGYIQNSDTIGLFTALMAGNDTVVGSNVAADVLYGFAGNDVMDGRDGADRMAGMSGNDRYNVDDLGDVVVELAGEGVDTVLSLVDFSLPDDVENLYLSGLAEQGGGNDLANQIFGSRVANTLDGLGGNDLLRGGEGGDTILGGAGDDLIDGGIGRDTLSGGTGADIFQFRDGDMHTTRTRPDTITDFSQAEGDRIQLTLVDANTGIDGDQRFDWIGNGAFTGAAGQLHYVHANGLTFIEGDTNGDAIADFVIALDGTIALTTADFNF